MSTQALKKGLNAAGNIVFVFLLIFVVVMGIFVIKSKIDGGTPNIAGNKLYIVLSGSMAPVFDAGSIVAVKDITPEQVGAGDIITFKDPADASRIITHRVMEVKKENGNLSFVTKGDANDALDTEPVPAGNVLGKAIFWVPYAGYIVDFTKSKKGLVFLLIVPGTLFILSELRTLFKLAEEYEKEQKRKKAESDQANA